VAILNAPQALVGRFNVGPLVVERRGAKTQNAFGGWTTPAANLITVNPIAAHTITGRDLDQVPEADRNTENVRFYTRGVRLRVADGGFLADVVRYRSRRYRISKVEDFDLQGNVYMAIGALVDVQDPEA